MLKLKVELDDCQESPREWDNLGIILASHRRYDLADEKNPYWGDFGSVEADFYAYIYAWFKDADYIHECGLSGTEEDRRLAVIKKWVEVNYLYLPVYMYEHSGISLSTGEFGCKWDSGHLGFIYVSRTKVREKFKVKRISPQLKAKILKQLENEIETYSQYLNGEVYCFVIEDEDGDVVDSCGGFYSEKEAREYGESELKALHASKLKRQIKARVPYQYREELRL